MVAASIVLAACAPAVSPQALPAPVSHVQAQTLTPSPPAAPTATNLPNLVQNTPGATLQELAQQQYGNRLIEWIEISALSMRAPAAAMGWEAAEWQSPDALVGWASNSALPDEQTGNVILYGHNNIHSSVFRDLAKLKSGDRIQLQTGEATWTYQVDSVKILSAQNEQEESEAYAAHFKQTYAPRLTLISCWPPTNNTHRVIVVSYPVLE
ncbi:MAG: sortase [Chloroflexi bacterium]|nr:sortase [Chloroflexota bacterium]